MKENREIENDKSDFTDLNQNSLPSACKTNNHIFCSDSVNYLHRYRFFLCCFYLFLQILGIISAMTSQMHLVMQFLIN